MVMFTSKMGRLLQFKNEKTCYKIIIIKVGIPLAFQTEGGGL